MPRRIIAVSLPHLAAELDLRREGQAGLDRPFAIVAQAGNALRLASVNRAAAALGLAPGLPLADARAICPDLMTRSEAPERLEAARRGLARWAARFSPIAAMEGDTLILDATGCAHLFGGEAAMLQAIAEGLAALSLTARPAMADTKGAAWGLAFFAPLRIGFMAPGARQPPTPPPHPATDVTPRDNRWLGGEVGWGAEPSGQNFPISPHGQTRAAIADLPVAALRIDAEAAEGLTALGLGTVGEAARIPRGSLARRFGLETLKRLDQALGAEPEPVAPDRPLPVFATRLTLPEPIGRAEDVMAGLERLLTRLCAMLESHQMGARALRLTARRADGGYTGATIRLARPGRDPDRLARLFEPKLADLEAEFGLDALRLEATVTEPLKPAQIKQVQVGQSDSQERLANLLSRIGNQIGFENLIRFLPAESHIPERAFTQAAAAWSAPEPFTDSSARPLILFPPEMLEVEQPAQSPHPIRGKDREGVPRFRWRGRWLTPAHAQGPERIAPEWWWDDPDWRTGIRDYWRVETAEGPRLWLFHTPQAAHRITGPAWWAQGEFP